MSAWFWKPEIETGNPIILHTLSGKAKGLVTVEHDGEILAEIRANQRLSQAYEGEPATGDIASMRQMDGSKPIEVYYIDPATHEKVLLAQVPIPDTESPITCEQAKTLTKYRIPLGEGRAVSVFTGHDACRASMVLDDPTLNAQESIRGHLEKDGNLLAVFVNHEPLERERPTLLKRLLGR